MNTNDKWTTSEDGLNAYHIAEVLFGEDEGKRVSASALRTLVKNSYKSMFHDVKDLQDIVIDSGNAAVAFDFALFIPGADVKALQRVVMRSADTSYLTPFLAIDGADIDALRASVIDHGTGWDAYKFAYRTQGKYTDQLQQVVIDRGEPIDAVHFAEMIDGADIPALQQKVMDGTDIHAIYAFACIQKDAVDLPSLQAKIIELSDKQDDKSYLNGFNNNMSIQDRLRNGQKSRARPV